jgi:hypothetical protein
VTRSLHGPLPREIADVLAHLPERVRIVWPHHQLCGAELVVHSWQRVKGEIHLLLTLPDGSRACLPAAATSLWEPLVDDDRPAVMLTADRIRQLHQLMDALQARTRRRHRSVGRKSK